MRHDTADPVFGNRAWLNAPTYTVAIPAARECGCALPPAPAPGRDCDADRVAHRPAERAVLAREARGLADRGLTPRDVADALGLSERAVVELLVEVCRARK